MRSLRIIGIIAMIIAFNLGLGFLLTNNQKSRIDSQPDAAPAVTLSVWLFSRGLVDVIQDVYVDDTTVKLDIHLFRSAEHLHAELAAAISANNAPQVAEVNSFHGIASLAQTGALMAVEPDWFGVSASASDQTFSSYFTYGGQQWAVPYGTSVPLLFHNENLLSHSGVSTVGGLARWADVREASRDVVTALGQPETRKEVWGIVVDQDVPWFWENMSQARAGGGPQRPEHLADVLRLWREFIFVDGTMPPLQQHQAVSDFIAGEAAFLLASSDKRSVLDRHVGGRFPIGASPLPDLTAAVPKLDGFAVIASSPQRNEAAIAFVEIMLTPEMQRQMWQRTAKTPVRPDVIDATKRQAGLDPLDKLLLEVNSSVHVQQAPTDKVSAWGRYGKIVASVENSPNVPVSELLQP